MDTEPTREEFLCQLIGNDPVPAYKITQPGDPVKQKQMKATLANRATVHKMQERFGEIENLNPLVINIREMRAFLLDTEMQLCGGG